jgi:RHH-type proline utilization regulon transcriptional repressor/proline dehydrogenase/delta 1-pyrroline-5-carboxylate dehydrogenase
MSSDKMGSPPSLSAVCLLLKNLDLRLTGQLNLLMSWLEGIKSMFFRTKTKPTNEINAQYLPLNPELKSIEGLGSKILASKADSKSLFNKDWWYGKIMDLSMKSPNFKTQMFRFVDVLPYLNDNNDVAKHLKEYFSDKDGGLPGVFSFGASLGSLAPGVLAGTVRKNVSEMARLFITGDSPTDAIPKLEAARNKQIGFTVDILGEATLSEVEALDYQNRYLDLISTLAEKSQSWAKQDLIDTNHLGDIPKVNVSVKLSSLYSQVKVAAWEESKKILIERVEPIFDLAMQKGVFINLDMEHYQIKDLTLDVFKSLLLMPKYKSYPHFGMVLQAYLRDSYDDAKTLIEFSKHRGVPFTVRLVKGAYWDSEVIHAKQNTWDIPVFTKKQESDANFELCTNIFLENYQSIHLAIGSHNVRSIASALIKAEELGVPRNALEVQMLFGMADNFKKSLLELGFRIREYATVGEMIPGMAYLVRRLLENTSNESFLRSSSASETPIDFLLKDPAMDLISSAKDPNLTGFINAPMIDFAETKQRLQFEAALKKVKAALPLKEIKGFINGQFVSSEKQLIRISPNDGETKICDYYSMNEKQVSDAISGAEAAFKNWQKTSVDERSKLMHRLADLIQAERNEIAALEVFEVGKPWAEADGDLTEAIDFCRYYAEDIKKIGAGQKVGSVPGENSHYHYIPKGVVGVIAPWNFPFAILAGMVAGALVTGNTVLIKPAEQSTATGYKLLEILNKLNLPRGVVQFLPGLGETVGAQIVKDPRVSMIAFTGSKEVGLKIIEQAGKVVPGQINVKTCMIEMGGKNAMIIDSDADLDEAVKAVIYSAFGFSGQKCSACSRVIVLPQNYDLFVNRLIEATKSIITDNPNNPQAFLGPVVDEDSYSRLKAVIEKGSLEATLAYRGDLKPEHGYYVTPTIFTDVAPDSFLAQSEFFGPILSVIKAKDIDEALDIANGTEFALTGGAYSRSPINIEKIKNQYEAGNVYINRTITGAMVDRHPFGGYKMSGLGSKTGGPDYLKQFMVPRVVTENTMRRGFSPDLIN